MDNHNIIILPADALPKIDELNGDLRILAEAVGVDTALLIGQIFQDTPIRLWGVKKFLRRYRDDRIRGESDEGVSVVRLARKYRLSERHVWNIVGKPSTLGPTGPKQIGLFK